MNLHSDEELIESENREKHGRMVNIHSVHVMHQVGDIVFLLGRGKVYKTEIIKVVVEIKITQEKDQKSNRVIESELVVNKYYVKGSARHFSAEQLATTVEDLPTVDIINGEQKTIII